VKIDYGALAESPQGLGLSNRDAGGHGSHARTTSRAMRRWRKHCRELVRCGPFHQRTRKLQPAQRETTDERAGGHSSWLEGREGSATSRSEENPGAFPPRPDSTDRMVIRLSGRRERFDRWFSERRKVITLGAARGSRPGSHAGSDGVAGESTIHANSLRGYRGGKDFEERLVSGLFRAGCA